ncbi:hypothetical protein [Spirillospora sp. NPDC047279]|uniref:hypothetical protein n=1 Tax=Spirillospora sp. NPDC047279 TaxID=3155478 RepID=UPI0033C567A2
MTGDAAPEERSEKAPGERAGTPSRRRRRLGLPWVTLAVLVVAVSSATALQVSISSALTDRGDLSRPPIARPFTSTSAPVPVLEPSSEPPVVSTVTPAETTAPPRSAPPDRDPGASWLSAAFRDMLTKFRFSVDQGLDAHEIRGDVARDLHNQARAAFGDSGSGDVQVLRRHVAKLRAKVGTRTGEGGITPHRAAELDVILDQARL